MDETCISQHSLGTTIAYHLLPGVVILAGYVLITPFIRRVGLPSAIGISLAVLFVLVPLELGILFWQGKRRNGRFSLEGIVLNREKTPPAQFALLMFAALFGAVFCFALLGWLDKTLLPLFAWLPDWFFINEDMSVYNKTIQFINWLVIFLLTGIVGPYVEELYFRGFLLPRLAWMKGWTPLVEAFLFALYHFWSPWQLATRTLAVLPLVYIVNRKRDLRIGVTAHWLLNTVGSLELLLMAFR
ncbi:MAG: CPBP family intramembrane metalloprotease [Anaerolineae bacterium]|nr:CPBP family intramembrane metalloprotease [Anaerolineae bacterium]